MKARTELLKILKELNRLLKELRTCPLDSPGFKNRKVLLKRKDAVNALVTKSQGGPR